MTLYEHFKFKGIDNSYDNRYFIGSLAHYLYKYLNKGQEVPKKEIITGTDKKREVADYDEQFLDSYIPFIVELKNKIGDIK